MKKTSIALALAALSGGLSATVVAADGATPAPVPVSPGMPVAGPAQPPVEMPAAAPKPGVASLADAQAAQAALDEMIRAYENGNVAMLQSRLDPAMIGYQRFLDGARNDANRLRQIRINLFDTQTTIGPDVAVIQTNWEKRFVGATDFRPGLFSGHSKFLMQRKKSGWSVIAFAGDNLFSSASGVLAQIRINGGSTVLPLPGGNIPTLAFQLEVIDPDMAGSGSITVDVQTGGGDRETVALAETSPGRFFATPNLTRVAAAAPSSGNGVIEVAGATSLTVRYLDRNPGDGRPPSTVTLTVQVR